MTEPTETDLRQALGNVAEAINPTSDAEAWNDLTDRLARQPEPNRDWSKRLVLAAAAVTVVAGIGALLAQPQNAVVETTGTTQPTPETTTDVVEDRPTDAELLREGEVIVSNDPLIVRAAIADPPRFDTSNLGTEVVFEQLDLDAPDVAEILESSWPGERWKATLVGRVDGRPLVASFEIGTMGRDGPPYTRTRRTSNAVTAVLWEHVSAGDTNIDRPADATVETLPPLPVGLTTWQLLPEGTSVVSYTDSTQRLWQQARDGLVAFPSQLDRDEGWEMIAYDIDGAPLDSRQGVADYDAFSTYTGVEIGDFVGTVLGADPETGENVPIEPDGRPVVFGFGASWCEPCETTADAMAQLDRTSIRVFAVPYFDDPGDRWAGDATHLALPQNRTLSGFVRAVPTVIVLDGEHNLVAVLEDATTLPDVLAELQ